MVGHVSELVQFHLVRLIHLVSVMEMHHIRFEHVKPFVLLTEALRNRVVTPPSLVQVPQAFLRSQILLMKIKVVGHSKNQRKGQNNPQELLHCHVCVWNQSMGSIEALKKENGSVIIAISMHVDIAARILFPNEKRLFYRVFSGSISSGSFISGNFAPNWLLVC